MELISADYGQEELQTRLAGDQFSQLHFFGQNLGGELMDVDLSETVDELDVPVFVFQGEADLITPPSQAAAFIDGLAAPHTEFVLLPRVGHDTFTQAADLILGELRQRVLPLVTQ
jgi:pimeloyl-ACP methyl ester carboxylesterase